MKRFASVAARIALGELSRTREPRSWLLLIALLRGSLMLDQLKGKNYRPYYYLTS